MIVLYPHCGSCDTTAIDSSFKNDTHIEAAAKGAVAGAGGGAVAALGGAAAAKGAGILGVAALKAAGIGKIASALGVIAGPFGIVTGIAAGIAVAGYKVYSKANKKVTYKCNNCWKTFEKG